MAPYRKATMKIHPLITTTVALAELCERLAKSDFVAVDTEFMRENTYYPLLCLVQIGNQEEAAAIDPLAEGIDLTPLLDLMCNNEEVLKVFHAGGQDVEIIYNLTGKTPHPIFDTQIAMMAISQSEQIGYSNLVESWLGLTIDKGARFTDWARRPLDARQIDYAIGDVTGAPWLAHKASHEGITAAEAIAQELGNKEVHPHGLDRRNIPGCTYCHPQIASVGLTEVKAKEAGYTVKAGTFPFIGNGKAIALGEPEGFIKTVFDAKTGELLGAHMIGAEVTELIQGYVVGRTLETTEAELMQTVFPHPTLSEMLLESTLAAYGRALHI